MRKHQVEIFVLANVVRVSSPRIWHDHCFFRVPPYTAQDRICVELKFLLRVELEQPSRTDEPIAIRAPKPSEFWYEGKPHCPLFRNRSVTALILKVTVRSRRAIFNLLTLLEASGDRIEQAA
jgi:hypothetical protein